MKLAEIAFRFRQSIEDGLLLRYIDPYRHDALVGAGQAMGGLLDRVLLDVGHDHVGAGFRERGRDAEANAGSGTGDDGGFTGDIHSVGLLDGFDASLARHGRRRNSRTPGSTKCSSLDHRLKCQESFNGCLCGNRAASVGPMESSQRPVSASRPGRPDEKVRWISKY